MALWMLFPIAQYKRSSDHLDIFPTSLPGSHSSATFFPEDSVGNNLSVLTSFFIIWKSDGYENDSVFFKTVREGHPWLIHLDIENSSFFRNPNPLPRWSNRLTSSLGTLPLPFRLNKQLIPLPMDPLRRRVSCKYPLASELPVHVAKPSDIATRKIS